VVWETVWIVNVEEEFEEKINSQYNVCKLDLTVVVGVGLCL